MDSDNFSKDDGESIIFDIKEMISKYYNIDNVSFDEITAKLYGVQADLLSYDSYY